MKILKSIYIPLSLVLISCSSSPVYRSETTLHAGVQKICGQAFCTETEVQNGLGVIHVSMVQPKAQVNPELIDMEAHCHQKAPRALHLRTQKLSSEVITLRKRTDHWEFPLKALDQGCRFELMVYTKKVHETFTFQPLREFIR